jgi:hypothetical protein
MEPKRISPSALATGSLVFILWLATVLAAVVEILLVQSIVVSLYARFGDDYATGLLLRNVSAVIMGIVCMIFVIGSGEFHLRHAGQASSWKLFAWTVGVELAILIIYLVL